MTVAGGNGCGNALNQLRYPHGLDIDDDNQSIVIADYGNHRIVEWKMGASHGKVIVGDQGHGNRLDQLNGPIDVLIDKETNNLYIADRLNRRVVRWSGCQGTTQGEVIVDNMDCWGLAIDHQRYLYVSDVVEHKVRRYTIRDKNGIVVAGANGQGNQLNQLNCPTYLFVDKEQTLYVRVRVTVNFIRRTFKETVAFCAMTLYFAMYITMAIDSNCDIELSTYTCTAEHVPK